MFLINAAMEKISIGTAALIVVLGMAVVFFWPHSSDVRHKDCRCHHQPQKGRRACCCAHCYTCCTRREERACTRLRR